MRIQSWGTSCAGKGRPEGIPSTRMDWDSSWSSKIASCVKINWLRLLMSKFSALRVVLLTIEIRKYMRINFLIFHTFPDDAIQQAHLHLLKAQLFPESELPTSSATPGNVQVLKCGPHCFAGPATNVPKWLPVLVSCHHLKMHNTSINASQSMIKCIFKHVDAFIFSIDSIEW